MVHVMVLGFLEPIFAPLGTSDVLLQKLAEPIFLDGTHLLGACTANLSGISQSHSQFSHYMGMCAKP